MQRGSGPDSPLDKPPIARLRRGGGLRCIVLGGICIRLVAHMHPVHHATAGRISLVLGGHNPRQALILYP